MSAILSTEASRNSRLVITFVAHDNRVLQGQPSAGHETPGRPVSSQLAFTGQLAFQRLKPDRMLVRISATLAPCGRGKILTCFAPPALFDVMFTPRQARLVIPMLTVLAGFLIIFACVQPWAILSADRPLSLWQWLLPDGDYPWGNRILMMAMVALSAAGCYLQGKTPPFTERTSSVWLGLFLALFLVFLAAIRIRYLALAITVAVPFLICGAAWIFGMRRMIRFWPGLLLLWLSIPPPMVGFWLNRARQVDRPLNGWSSAPESGWSQFEAWRYSLERITGGLPHPVTTIVAAIALCTFIPQSRGARVITLILGALVAAINFPQFGEC